MECLVVPKKSEVGQQIFFLGNKKRKLMSKPFIHLAINAYDWPPTQDFFWEL